MKPSRNSEIELLPGESIDNFMDGRLKLIQSKTGYRFSIDAILLSEFVTIKKGDTVADLGIGCGIIPLLLFLRRPLGYAFGLEIQDLLADQTARNIKLNKLTQKMSVIHGDIRTPPVKPGAADVVICNPPYRKKESGRINPNRQRAIARHEIMASLDDILAAAEYILNPGGRLAMIYPSERLADLMLRMRGSGMEPKRLRIIYPGMEFEAKLAMVEAYRGGKSGLKILPPLIGQGDTIRNQA
jgi:tRNA1(Val) A37 N6-methylase TrmN6